MLAMTQPLFNYLWLALFAAFLTLSGFPPARADETVDKQRRENALRTQELKCKMVGVLHDARDEARKNPAAAVDSLRQFRSEVEGARFLSDGDRKALLRTLDTHIARYLEGGRPIRPSANNKGVVKDARHRLLVARTLTGLPGEVHCLAFAPDGKLLASGSEDGSVRLWDVVTGKTHHILKGRDERVWSLAFTADGKTLFSAGTERGTLTRWDVATGK